MNDQTLEIYVAAEEKVQQGFCPLCNEALRNNQYCPTHGFIMSGVGTLIDGNSYDSKMLELVIGCR